VYGKRFCSILDDNLVIDTEDESHVVTKNEIHVSGSKLNNSKTIHDMNREMFISCTDNELRKCGTLMLK